MGRTPLAARVTLIAAAMVLLAGVVSASIPGLFNKAGRSLQSLNAPTVTTVPGVPTTLPPAPTSVAAAPTTTTTAQIPPSTAPASVPISRSATLPRTGPLERNLLPTGIALILLGGVLVLGQQPEPYAPRHLQRRRAKRKPDHYKRQIARRPVASRAARRAVRPSAVQRVADDGTHLLRLDQESVVSVHRVDDRHVRAVG
jgi:hypothetical protein